MRPTVTWPPALRRVGAALRPLVVPPGLTPAATAGFVACALVLGVLVGTFGTSSSSSSDGGPSAALAAALNRPVASAAPAATTGAADDADDEAVDEDAADDETADAAAEEEVVTEEAAPAEAAATADSGDGAGDDLPADGEDEGDDAAPTEATAPIRHLWIVSVSGRPAAASLTGRSGYLGTELAAKGTVLAGYAPGSASVVAASTALLSGQRPTAQALAGCPRFTDVPDAPLAEDGTIAGDGCVYPASVPTLPARVVAEGRTWRGYVTEPTPCRRPAPGAEDPWRVPTAADPYVTARNPFVWFHGITDGDTCGKDVVPAAQLATDVADAAKAPTVSWVVPDATGSGQGPAAPDGGDVPGLDAWLRATVAPILDSAAYADGGAVLIVPDAGSPVAPGVATGALLISAKTKAGRRDETALDPPGLLRTISDLVGVDPPGVAAATGTTSLAEPLTDVVAPGTDGAGDRDL